MLPIVNIDNENVEVFAPYTGICIRGDEADEGYLDDPTLFFCDFGVGEPDIHSERVTEQLDELGLSSAENLTAETLVSLLSFDGGVALRINDGWNGISWFVYAPIKI